MWPYTHPLCELVEVQNLDWLLGYFGNFVSECFVVRDKPLGIAGGTVMMCLVRIAVANLTVETNLHVDASHRIAMDCPRSLLRLRSGPQALIVG